MIFTDFIQFKINVTLNPVIFLFFLVVTVRGGHRHPSGPLSTLPCPASSRTISQPDLILIPLARSSSSPPSFYISIQQPLWLPFFRSSPLRGLTRLSGGNLTRVVSTSLSNIKRTKPWKVRVKFFCSRGQ